MKYVSTLVLMVACGDGTTQRGGDDEAGDTAEFTCDGEPKVDHDELDGPQQSGVAVLINATVVADPTEGCEEEGLIGVWLYHKAETDTQYSSTGIPLRLEDGNVYSGSIDGADVRNTAAIEYYFEAVGEDGDTTIEPAGADTNFRDAYRFTIAPAR